MVIAQVLYKTLLRVFYYLHWITIASRRAEQLMVLLNTRNTFDHISPHVETKRY